MLRSFSMPGRFSNQQTVFRADSSSHRNLRNSVMQRAIHATRPGIPQSDPLQSAGLKPCDSGTLKGGPGGKLVFSHMHHRYEVHIILLLWSHQEEAGLSPILLVDGKCAVADFWVVPADLVMHWCRLAHMEEVVHALASYLGCLSHVSRLW